MRSAARPRRRADRASSSPSAASRCSSRERARPQRASSREHRARCCAALIGEDVELVTSLAPGRCGRVRGRPRPARAGAGEPRGQRARRDAGRRHADASRRANVELDAARGGTRAGRRARAATSCSRSPTPASAWTPTTSAHVFEPFFTTKEHGQGHRPRARRPCYGIVKQSGGQRPGRQRAGPGHDVHGALCRAIATRRGPAEARSRRRAACAAAAARRSCSSRTSRRCGRWRRRILEASGYAVLSRDRGGRGAGAGRPSIRGEIDLLLTDVVMPEMSGPELAERLAALRPGTRVLFMSGYADNLRLRRGLSSRTPCFSWPSRSPRPTSRPGLAN